MQIEQIGSRLPLLSPSSLRGGVRKLLTKFNVLFAVDSRRGNLLSLIDPREFFNHKVSIKKDALNTTRGCKPLEPQQVVRFANNYKTTPQRTQSKEIASGMIQRLSSLTFITLLTTPRNDEVWCEWRESQTVQLQFLRRGNLCGY